MAPDARRAFLIEQAAAAGPVVIYNTSNPTIVEQWQAAVSKDIPEVEFQLTRLDSATANERHIAESEAGQPVASVADTIAAPLNTYLGKNMLATYRSPEAATFDASNIDADGKWAAQTISPMVIGYNTDLVPADQAPKNWQDLTNPAFAGKMGRTGVTNGPTWVAGMLEAFGQEAGMKLIQDIAAQKPRLFDSNSALSDALASGQVSVIFDTQLVNIIQRKDKGAPVAPVVPDPLFMQPTFTAILADAPNPYGAALYVDWLLSKDGGQKVLLDNAIIGPRPDVAYENEDLIKAAQKVVGYTPALPMDDSNETTFVTLFQQ
jgi:iron(III) transport system substrate-binding protein